MFALGIVLTVASLAAVALYTMRAKTNPSSPRKGFAVAAGAARSSPEIPTSS